jgi:mono/diheme cytochrome c family protein
MHKYQVIMRTLLPAVRFLPVLCFCLLPQIASAQSFPALPPGPGRDVMASVCSNCHSPELASTQAHDEAGWRDVLTQMTDNGAQFTPAQSDAIVHYLSTVFPQK